MKDAYTMMQDCLISEAEEGVMEDDDYVLEVLSDGESAKCCEDDEDIDDDVEEIEDDDDEEV